MNIGSIVWPSDIKEANRLYLGFLLSVIECLGITFRENDPVPIARRYISGGVSDHELRDESLIWWDYIESRGALRRFQDEDILKARLALCLLLVPSVIADLGEHLSWFFEVLGFLSVDMDVPHRMMETYFTGSVS